MPPRTYAELPIADFTTLEKLGDIKYDEGNRELITEMQTYLEELNDWSRRPRGALPDLPSNKAIEVYTAAVAKAKLGGRKNKSRKNKRRNRKSRRY
jgi:hypothetical protein